MVSNSVEDNMNDYEWLFNALYVDPKNHDPEEVRDFLDSMTEAQWCDWITYRNPRLGRPLHPDL